MSFSSRLTGGEKLEKALKLIAAKAKNGGVLSVGFPAGSTYPDGTSVPLVAAMNEFGHLTRDGSYYVMPRPFFRNMIEKESPHWGSDLGKLLKAADYDALRALAQMGEEIEGELAESITTLESPPLAPSTIAAKGFAKPLIDTGHMLDSIDSFVDEST